ncbi:endonuclease/exonuclease/phosphatase family protein [Pelagicoccus mobilis]|uniref:Endonuclease/exonuclease/phosphatase family protein n=1 Tax=Pelagicoccus mobilis TaxID=415221 RepID=A0A934RUB8_9BACT|nr:endonuclease/exonuclease/phosphatase family protein [Pelagicoccus mobilis]MBK1875565.1 endonuclease/exonuclease/phosphatase family protein [Pelagicoccus mobilis]
MKFFTSILLLLTVTVASAEELTLMSYNIRLDLASDAPNNWDNRKEQLAAQVVITSPDILGIQEGLPHQVSFLDEQLADYSYLGVGRDDGKSAGEFSALFYRKDKYKILDSGTFWLSDTPDEPSFGWGASYRRICTYAHFKNKESGNSYWVFNTHLDHQVAAARLNGVKLILDRISKNVSEGEQYFLMGDLNATPDLAPIKLISKSMIDGHRHSKTPSFGQTGTMNNFDTQTVPSRRIDYIFSSRSAGAPDRFGTLSDLVDGRFISDHFPVVATFTLQD